MDVMPEAEKEFSIHTTGVDQTGCMFCCFGCHLEKAPNRFQRMQKTHPNQWNFCMKPVEDGGLGLREILEYLGVPYSSKGGKP